MNHNFNKKTADAFSLSGKRILVADADSILGEEISIAFSRIGARIIAVGNNNEGLTRTISLLSGNGHTLISGRPLDLIPTLRLIEGGEIKLDGVVLCPLQEAVDRKHSIDDERVEGFFRKGIVFPIGFVQGVADHGLLTEGASVVFNLSTVAHKGLVGQGVQSSISSAVLGFIRCFAIEQSVNRVRVNGISSSIVNIDNSVNCVSKTQDYGRNSAGSISVLSDVANAFVFLMADCSRWITGTSIIFRDDDLN